MNQSQGVAAKAVRLLLTIEAVGVSALAATLALLMAIKGPGNLAAALFELFFAVAVAAGLWVASRGQSLRSAAILLNIMALPISRTLYQGERTLIALPVALLALATLIALFVDRPIHQS